MKCAIKDCENQVSLLCSSCHALISGEGLPSQAYRNSRRMIETALIKQTEQEPVGWLDSEGRFSYFKHLASDEPLYTAPPKREWVGLTGEDIDRLTEMHLRAYPTYPGFYGQTDFARAIDALLKEKNT